MGLLEEIRQRNLAVEKRVWASERECERMAERVDRIERRLEALLELGRVSNSMSASPEKTGTIKRV
jgi:hypothetical protein